MARIWVVSDTHFGHSNILNFTDKAGKHIRPFSSIKEHDERIVDEWNSLVHPSDHVYHLGDVAMKKEPIEEIIPKLNGHLRLVRGNHDIFDTAWYLKYFDQVYGVRVLEGLLLSHIPLHPESVGRFRGNVHGHTHAAPELAGKYISVCLEKTGWQPRLLSEVGAELDNKVALWKAESMGWIESDAPLIMKPRPANE